MDRISLVGLTLQNLRRKPYRTILIGLCVVLATSSLFVITLILSGIQTSLKVGQARLGADLVVVPKGFEISAQESFITGQPSTFYMCRDMEARIASVAGVAHTSAQVYVQTLSNASCCTGEFFLVGYDPTSDFTITPWLRTHLPDKSLDPQEVIVGDRILLRETDSASFFGSIFTVAGVLEKTGMGIDRTIYIPMPGIRAMIEASEERSEQELVISPLDISAIMVQSAPGYTVAEVAEAIEMAVPEVQAFTTSQLNQAVNRQLRSILQMFLGINVALWLMSLLIVGFIFSVVVNERQREFGLLRAMGARQSFISKLVILEALMVTGLSGLIGVAAALILLISFSKLIQKVLMIPYLMPSYLDIGLLTLVLLLLSLASGALASLLPALRTSRMVVYEAIRKGE